MSNDEKLQLGEQVAVRSKNKRVKSKRGAKKSEGDL